MYDVYNHLQEEEKEFKVFHFLKKRFVWRFGRGVRGGMSSFPDW
jgi:hypothetical protein